MQQLRHVLHPQVDAQVRLVGAELLHGLEVGDAHKRCLGGGVVRAVLGEDGGQHLLDDGEHVLLPGKGHLHIQLVELAGGAVAPGVLVPEAGGDLEVLVKAGGHQQLLELLGRLGQGVEFPRVLPGGHQVVPGPLGGGGGEDGGGDLQKALVLHGPAQGGHHLAAQDDLLLHLGVAQVQVAVLQALALVRVLGEIHLEGQLVVPAAAQHLNLAGHHLDVPGGELGVLAGALPHHTGHGDGGLLVQGLYQVHHLLGLHHHLGGAVKVPQDQEGEVAPHLPQVFQPPGQGNGLAHMLHAQFAAGVGAVFCLFHILSLSPIVLPASRKAAACQSKAILLEDSASVLTVT